MPSPVTRFTAILAGAGLALAGAAAPAAAAGPTFALRAGAATASGSYAFMMSIPERPVPPIRIRGTLTVAGPGRCGVVQLAQNGPADGIEWRTLARRCGPGRRAFGAEPGYLWGGFAPQLRLCVGRTVAKAELGRRCAVHHPPAEH
ncbi:hypothetical protein GCM10020358_36510 [Amorphoplanes nipponensis]|uniref:Neocarzinostatin family protein n=1 Tax=Actinoplanes nipponensis TaxID=135950 RepID=A0A919MQN2_9ACTN|nr:hypothetical protein [Actinoplanes nipponensis]GIE53826.1 hypothetical protein Ani05nite_73600 [Actinoplanes nipponensis]